MKKILFPTDFSELSLNAFRYALHIADRFGATISTIHTYTAPIVGTTPAVMVEEMTALTEQLEMQQYQEFSEKLRKVAEEENLEHVQTDHLLEYGLAIPEIARISRREAYDFIIMGTAGEQGFGTWLFGSYATSMISSATCPILVVPDEAVYHPIERIAYATNLEDVDDDVLADLVQWTSNFGASLQFVHVAAKGKTIDGEQYANMTEISEIAARYDNIEFKILYADDNADDIADELEDYVEDANIDVLLMVTHKYSFFQRIFNPSVTRKMALESEVPLLIYQAPKN